MLAKAKLNTIEFLISKALIESYNNHDQFVSVSNVLREYNDIKVAIESPDNRQMRFGILELRN